MIAAKTHYHKPELSNHAKALEGVKLWVIDNPRGMSMTQDRKALNDIALAISAGTFIASATVAALSISSSLATGTILITSGAVLGYGIYDRYDRRHGDHTNRGAHIGTFRR